MTEARFHPNGFIQFDLPSGNRLHVWSDELPRGQKFNTPIHDHTFNFKSRIIAGELNHTVYGFAPDNRGNYDLYAARPFLNGDDTTLENLGERGEFTIIEDLWFGAGDGYQFKAGWFHETRFRGAGPLRVCASIMTKTEKNLRPYARVACPVGELPDNDFRRGSLSQEFLMEYVNAVCIDFVPATEFVNA